MSERTSAERSRVMRAVRGKNTEPEMVVRRLVHRMGVRFRLHCADLPGKPDMVFRSRRKVIFVHGCFWHGHQCARGNRLPKSNTSYWAQKIARNRERDQDHRRDLESAGWEVFTVWECDLKQRDSLEARLRRFLLGSDADPV